MDPFFHYRAPNTEKYFYALNNERSQNDGILRHFNYDAIITGTSMTMNFKTSEADSLFGFHSIKIPMPGARFLEMSDLIRRSFKYNPQLKAVIRGLDSGYLDLNDQSFNNNLSYLYNDSLPDDINYLLNRDLFFGRALPMLVNSIRGDQPGITSFDDYSRWALPSGLNAATVDGVHVLPAGEPVHMSEQDEKKVRENISRNIAASVEEHPDTEFYFFFSPYSILWWQSLVEDGTIYRQSEMEALTSEILLQYDNVHLFSFSCRPDIITDLNNYGDPIHYCSWINSLILKWMSDNVYRLNQDNYQEYFRQELNYYVSFDYTSLLTQTDYEDDLLAAALVEDEINGITPHIAPWEES